MDDISSRPEAEALGRQTSARPAAKIGNVAALAAVIVGGLWWSFSYFQGGTAGQPAAPPLPQVVVSTPLQRELDARMGFLGQFSAVDQVEIRAQVGGTLTEIHFKDGDIVHKGDLLFVIDPVPDCLA